MKMNWDDAKVLEFARLSTNGAYGDFTGCEKLRDKLARYKEMQMQKKPPLIPPGFDLELSLRSVASSTAEIVDRLDLIAGKLEQLDDRVHQLDFGDVAKGLAQIANGLPDFDADVRRGMNCLDRIPANFDALDSIATALFDILREVKATAKGDR